MQDRFKFRAWNNKANFMFTVGDKHSIARLWKMPNISLMQCTGLKDCTGTLIYEGDIVVIPSQYPYFDYLKGVDKDLNATFGKIEGESISNYVGIVKWVYSQWQVVLKCVNLDKVGISDGINNPLNDEGFDEDENSHWLVLGNRHQNPELLQEEQVR